MFDKLLWCIYYLTLPILLSLIPLAVFIYKKIVKDDANKKKQVNVKICFFLVIVHIVISVIYYYCLGAGTDTAGTFIIQQLSQAVFEGVIVLLLNK